MPCMLGSDILGNLDVISIWLSVAFLILVYLCNFNVLLAVFAFGPPCRLCIGQARGLSSSR